MAKKRAIESDESYFLKVVLYFLLGLVWIKVAGRTVFPAGLIVGLFLAQKDHFAIDRKVEYVILVFAAALAFIGYGFFLNITNL